MAKSKRRIGKIGLWILGVLIIILIGFAVFINSLKPKYNGELTLNGVSQEVEVYYDTYGIPHIYAQSEEDALRALGYVHAQDRLWQMELLRRVASGRLSEVFGKDLLETDRFFLALGIDEATAKTTAALDVNASSFRMANAYLSGVNAFVEKGATPVEYYLTGLEKTLFSIEDVYNSLGYMSFSFALANKTDPLVSNIKNTLGEAYLQDLELSSNTNTQWIGTHSGKQDTILNTLVAATNSAFEKLPVPQFMGSNSWVLSPEKTKNGKVIFANDPHIGFAQPAVWYEAHLNAPSYEKYGYYLAGIPFPLLAHDRGMAYGLTMFENDDIDFYYEELNPSDSTEYKTETGWKPLAYSSKTIKVKGEPDELIQIAKTRHGPLMNQYDTKITIAQPISMDWIYTQRQNRTMEALYGMSHASSLNDFEQAVSNIHAPGLNVMYGDSTGNVAWWAAAQLYKKRDSLSTKAIMDGTSGKDEIIRFLEFNENPQAINPPWKYVYSANNQPDSTEGGLIPGYYLPENRAKRIVQLLEAKQDWDLDATKKMITDATSAVNPHLAQVLVAALDRSTLDDTQLNQLERFKEWKGDYPLTSTLAGVYHRWVYFLLKNTFEDELGEKQFEQFLTTMFVKRLLAPLASKENSVWWDDIHTPEERETRVGVIQKSYQEAWQSLVDDLGSNPDQWTWNKLHTLEHEHPLGSVAQLRPYFNVGPDPVNASREVINNMNFTYDSSLEYKVTSGPSTRRVIDFSDVENSYSVIPTGQSGNPLSEHYDDQSQMFLKGKFRKMMMNAQEIKNTSKNKLSILPTEK